jgi:hypothetical protein
LRIGAEEALPVLTTMPAQVYKEKCCGKVILMRNLLILVSLTFFALGAFGLGVPASKISQLPDGTLSGNVYSNDALGLSFEFPGEWKADPDPKKPAPLDDRKPDEIANQCSKVLLSLYAPRQVEGKFSSVATLFAIDPGCFSGTEFPRSLDKAKIQKLADKIIKTYSHSPFISPYGAFVVGYLSQGRVVIRLTQGFVINALYGHPAPKKEPLNVNDSIILEESNGYWIAWAYLADDPSAEELKNVKFEFKDAPPR